MVAAFLPVCESRRAGRERRDHPGLVLCPVVVVPEGVRGVGVAAAARHRRVQRLPLRGEKEEEVTDHALIHSLRLLH